MVRVRVGEVAAPAYAVAGVRTDVLSVSEAIALVANVYLLAVQRAGYTRCAVPNVVGHLQSVERDDTRGRVADALGRQR